MNGEANCSLEAEQELSPDVYTNLSHRTEPPASPVTGLLVTELEHTGKLLKSTR